MWVNVFSICMCVCLHVFVCICLNIWVCVHHWTVIYFIQGQSENLCNLWGNLAYHVRIACLLNERTVHRCVFISEAVMVWVAKRCYDDDEVMEDDRDNRENNKALSLPERPALLHPRDHSAIFHSTSLAPGDLHHKINLPVHIITYVHPNSSSSPLLLFLLGPTPSTHISLSLHFPLFILTESVPREASRGRFCELLLCMIYHLLRNVCTKWILIQSLWLRMKLPFRWLPSGID